MWVGQHIVGGKSIVISCAEEAHSAAHDKVKMSS